MKFRKLFGREKQHRHAPRANEFMLESLEPRLLLSATPVTAAVVITDHLDYAPGETTVITTLNQAGGGLKFSAGELIRFQVSRTDGIVDYAGTTASVGPEGNQAWYVIDGIGGFVMHQEFDETGQAVDRDGNGIADWIAPDNDLTVNSSISTTWFVEEQYRHSSLLVTAAAQESGAVATQSFTDAKINTTTAVSSTIATSSYGDTVTFTARVTPAVGSARPEGSVEFFDGTRSLGIDSTADKGSGATSIFTISLSGFTAGIHSIHAVFTGDAGHGSERAGSDGDHGPDHRDRHRDLDGHRHDREQEESHRRSGQERHHHGHADHDESGKHSQYNSSISGNLAQTVSQKSLAGSFTVANKAYDGNASATVLTRALAGVLGNDDVSLVGGTAAFTDANAGAGKLVTLTGAMLTGTAASNYSLTLPVTTTATVAKATATITGADRNGSGYFGTYDGQAHAATATVMGVGGANLGTVTSATIHTNAGTYSDTVTFLGDGNYKAVSKTVKSYILQATATITGADRNGSGYFGTYDGQAHAATATVTGIGGASLGTITSVTTHANVGTYSDTVTFAGDVNYKASSKVLKTYILQATATITGADRNGSGYFGTYDGQAHAATATVMGVGGANLGTVTSATIHTNAGTYSDTVTFLGDGNYKAVSKTVKSYILQATATIIVSGYNVVFDGNAHTATGTATGVNGEDLSFGLNLSFTTHTAKGVYLSEAVTFTGGMNYKDAIKLVSSRIS
ncbi:MAG: LEPR-XLL domain-containing protein [Nitrospiraceae bacterium]|nr:LEPR-XLL domain-containing protein [Nitrospiraceae bacterium]